MSWQTPRAGGNPANQGYMEQGYAQPGYPQPGYPQPQPGYPSYGNGGYPPSVPPASFMPNPPMDDYPQENFGSGNFDQTIRKAFIRKVYSILMVQLLFTLACIAFFVFHEPTNRFARQNAGLYYVGFILLFVVLIVLACCGEVRRKHPLNIILLSVYTLVQAFMLGIVTAAFRVEEVMYAVGITAVLCLALTLFAFQTKWDFTVLNGALLCAGVCFMLFGFIAIFFPGPIMRLVYASIGALLFSVYLVFDTQLMMGGKHKYSVSPEEYIFAALNLYADIVAIFLMILNIFGATRD